MNFTKNYTMRARLNRDLDHTEDFKNKYLLKEYGNYEKYEKNKITTEYDEGPLNLDKDKFYENYINFIKRLPTREAQLFKENKREEIHNLLTNQDYTHREFGMLMTDHAAQEPGFTYNEDTKLDDEIDFLEDPENFDKEYNGRLSPFVKEKIYREYLQGKPVKDLSLKYGILQQRVKAIVWQKHLYWEEVYPKMGETHMRLALEREAVYASEFPFIEYGQDLHVMSAIEKGAKVEFVTRSQYDTNPPAEMKEDLEYFLNKHKCSRSDKIPLKLIGKGKR